MWTVCVVNAEEVKQYKDNSRVRAKGLVTLDMKSEVETSIKLCLKIIAKMLLINRCRTCDLYFHIAANTKSCLLY